MRRFCQVQRGGNSLEFNLCLQAIFTWATVGLSEPVEVKSEFANLHYKLFPDAKLPKNFWSTWKQERKNYPYDLILSEDSQHINIIPRHAEWPSSEGFLALNFTGVGPKHMHEWRDARRISAYNVIVTSPMPTFLYTAYRSMGLGKTRIQQRLDECLRDSNCEWWFKDIQLPTRQGINISARLIKTSLSKEDNPEIWTKWEHSVKDVVIYNEDWRRLLRPCFQNLTVIDDKKTEKFTGSLSFVFEENKIKLVNLRGTPHFYDYNLIDSPDPTMKSDPLGVKLAFEVLCQSKIPVFVFSQAALRDRKEFIRNFMTTCGGSFWYRDVCCEGGNKVRLITANALESGWHHFGGECKEDHAARFQEEIVPTLIAPQFQTYPIEYRIAQCPPDSLSLKRRRHTSEFLWDFVFENNKIVARRSQWGLGFYAYNLMDFREASETTLDGPYGFVFQKRLPIFVETDRHLPRRKDRSYEFIHKLLNKGFFWYKEADCGNDKKVLLIKAFRPKSEDQGWISFCNRNTGELTEPPAAESNQVSSSVERHLGSDTHPSDNPADAHGSVDESETCVHEEHETYWDPDFLDFVDKAELLPDVTADDISEHELFGDLDYEPPCKRPCQ